ncbi:protein translocase subunit [Mollisiaceae sp. DMI_Dod_QoI]|nr:protein translocase subunit [Helotiales sp. DMI_Dod_QoI]
MDNISNGLGFGGASDPKTAVMNQVRQEAAMTNARQLIEKVNEHCFEKCVPKPGSSLSSGETTCFTQCMEKYMQAWNTVSRQYITRIQQENSKGAAGGGIF